MANHPIEFAVVAGMLLPLAIWLGMHDREKSSMRRWLPVALITMSIPMSVSRSGILAAITSLTLFTVLLPATQRVWLLAVTPVAAVAVFVSTPGYLRTIFGSFTGAQSDASVLNRVNNYPRVIAAFEKAPWIGHGPNTDIQVDLTKVLDNQYLKSSIELGGLGVLALCLYFLVPALTALWARSRTSDPRFRALCAALAGGSLAAGVGSYTFDAFSFAQFASVDAIVVGLCGACWLLTQREPQAFLDSTAESAPPEPWSPKVSAVSAGPIPSPAK
jgi:O-antigen ligase